MSIRYVDQWPRVIGMTANPTAEQCRAAGYELTANKPQDMIDAEQAAIEQAAQEHAAHDALVAGLRAKYRQTCNGFCLLAGITVVDKFEDESAITSAIEAANTAENYTLALRLTQLAMALQFTITEVAQERRRRCMGAHVMKQKLISLRLLPILAFGQWEMDFDEDFAAASSKKAEWANPYVTDGLVAMWDGEKSVDNRDIIKRLKLTLGSNTSYTNNYWYSSVKGTTVGAVAPIDTYNSINSGTFTIEMPYYIIDSSQASYMSVTIRSGISNLVYVDTSGFNNDVTAASWINLGPGYHFISYQPQNPNDYQSSTVTLTVSNTLVRAFVSGVYKVSNTLGNTITTADSIGMGGAKMRIYGLRIYNRILTSTEIAHNYSIDKARFGL